MRPVDICLAQHLGAGGDFTVASPSPIKKLINKVTEVVKSTVEYVTNDDEQKVLETKNFAFYKGVPVFRTDGDRSGSFGAIFLTRETNQRTDAEEILRHEYGHTKQLEILGPVKYLACIGVPSYFEWGSESSYYRRPWELTASMFGGDIPLDSSSQHIYAGINYLIASDLFGIISWFLIE